MRSSLKDEKRIAGIGLAMILVSALSLLGAAAQKKTEQNQWKKDWGPLVPHQTFPKDCSICHLPKRWDALRKDFSFDHAKETGYPLEGAHAAAACLRCHNDRGPVTVYVARGCGGCHVDPHKGSLGMDCTRCHTQNTWEVKSQTLQHAGTRFPLTGVHQTVACVQCHTHASAGDFKGAQPDCTFCHKSDFEKAPNHASMGFPQKCDTCHRFNTWTGATFDHALVPGTGGSCIRCHSADYARAPNHGPMGYSQTCESCHTTKSWKGTTFNHSLVAGANASCSSCHMADYQRALNHVSMSFPQNCQTCHNTTAWKGASFDHSLIPAGNTSCSNCHQADFQRAANHVALGFPQTCQTCHTTANWTSNFSHRFPLTGNHNVSCAVCHNAGTTQSFTCLVCHAHDQTPMNDKHQNINGYSYSSPACYNCHPNGRKQ